MKRYDAAVIGLGGMGSAAVAHLAKRGADVIGLDRFPMLHALGASAGRSRIIRKAYFEDLAYVPLLERAYTLWNELESQTTLTLRKMCGVLVVGDESTSAARGVLQASQRYGIAVEVLDAAAVRTRYPQMRPLDDEIGIYEPDAGVVFPEHTIAAHLDVALAHGAVLAGDVPVTGWRRTANGALSVQIDDVDAFETERIVVCAGPWTSTAFERLGLPIHVQRNVQYWFKPLEKVFSPDAFPAFFLERRGLPAPLYGFPDLGDGVKAALHGYGETTTADDLNRDVSAREVEHMRRLVMKWLPDAAGDLQGVKVCMYAMTPDEHFVIGTYPEDERVVFAGGFSGHGFKFVPVIGEILAQLALDGGTELDIAFLSPARFTTRNS